LVIRVMAMRTSPMALISSSVKFAFFANWPNLSDNMCGLKSDDLINAFKILTTIKAALLTLMINSPFGNIISSFIKIYKIFLGNFWKKGKIWEISETV